MITTYVAFLRAVNVGGTGKLPMAELRSMCEELGFENVQTYIASGNVVLTSELSTDGVRKALEDPLEQYAGKAVGVVVRTGAAVRAIVEANPFPDANPSYTLVTLLNDDTPPDAVDQAKRRAAEDIVLAEREIYVHYPNGMSKSKLRIPAADAGTARNMNTLRKMAELAEAITAS